MSSYRPTDDDVTTAEWLDGQTQTHPMRSAARPPTAPSAAPASEPVYSYGPEQTEDDEYSEFRQRERFGGINWGAAFFGWLVAAGLVVLLAVAVAAGVAALGLTDEVQSAGAKPPPVGAVASAAALLGALLVASYTGGYVAGRMSRFDGGKQGVAVWIIGLLLGGAGAGLALLADSRFGTLDRLSLATMPVPGGAGPLGGVVIAVAAVLASLLFATVGGKVGCRYHRKVDNAAYR